MSRAQLSEDSELAEFSESARALCNQGSFQFCDDGQTQGLREL